MMRDILSNRTKLATFLSKLQYAPLIARSGYYKYSQEFRDLLVGTNIPCVYIIRVDGEVKFVGYSNYCAYKIIARHVSGNMTDGGGYVIPKDQLPLTEFTVILIDDVPQMMKLYRQVYDYYLRQQGGLFDFDETALLYPNDILRWLQKIRETILDTLCSVDEIVQARKVLHSIEPQAQGRFQAKFTFLKERLWSTDILPF